jgi:hypothetical protein
MPALHAWYHASCSVGTVSSSRLHGCTVGSERLATRAAWDGAGRERARIVARVRPFVSAAIPVSLPSFPAAAAALAQFRCAGSGTSQARQRERRGKAHRNKHGGMHIRIPHAWRTASRRPFRKRRSGGGARGERSFGQRGRQAGLVMQGNATNKGGQPLYHVAHMCTTYPGRIAHSLPRCCRCCARWCHCVL